MKGNREMERQRYTKDKHKTIEKKRRNEWIKMERDGVNICFMNCACRCALQ